ncbi:MAG: hypothetical protein MUC36_04730 [Planctomycetes bacterium]|nr:hypothetical protein [Planctomycetota bacterium]
MSRACQWGTVARWLLTTAQGTLWGPFTLLLGGAFAALGAAIVRGG